MRACSCANTLNNTGQTNCQPLMRVARKIIIVPTYDSTGARNKLATATALAASAATALINQADKTKRWYPSPELVNVGGERAESTFEEAPSGKKAFIKQGARTMTFEIWDEGAEFKLQLDGARCTDFGIYIVDAEGSIYGMVPAVEDGYLYPIRVDKGSWDARLIFPTETTTGKLNVSFNWNTSEDDALLRTISASDYSTTSVPDLLNIEGLLDVSMVIHSITTTVATVSFFERYGSRYKKNKVKGLVTADFQSSVTATASKVRELSATPGDLTFVLAEQTGVETAISGPGTYTMTWAAQTSGDILQAYAVKTGFDFYDILATTILIP